MRDRDLNDDALSIMNASVNSISKSWHVLRQTQMTWNIKGARQNIDKLRLLLDGLADQWQSADNQISALISAIREQLESPAYASELEQELKSAGVPISGAFPQYFLPPFKMAVSVDNLEVRLSLGRKSERTSDLNPKQLAAWVAVRYKKVISRKFNAQAFMKDLLEAYQFANRITFLGKEPIWGRAVSLMDLYDIMTVKATSRQDYPKQFFVFDLGLLKESPTMELDPYRFELGFARHQSRALVVVDSSGRENHFSSLTIYRDEGGQ